MQKTPVNPTYWLPNPSALQCHHDYRGKFHPWLSAHPSTLDSSQALINISHVDKLYYYPPSFLIWEPDTLVTLGQSQSDHSWDFRSVYFHLLLSQVRTDGVCDMCQTALVEPHCTSVFLVLVFTGSHEHSLFWVAPLDHSSCRLCTDLSRAYYSKKVRLDMCGTKTPFIIFHIYFCFFMIY